jgi:hypothetical protein
MGSKPVLRILGRDEILAVNDLKTETVPVPEWGAGVAVIVRSLTGAERDTYEAEMLGQASGEGEDRQYDLGNIRAKLAARTIVDEAGKRLFSEADVVALGEKNASALDRVAEVARRLSRISAADVKAAKAALGNAPSGAAGSA